MSQVTSNMRDTQNTEIPMNMAGILSKFMDKYSQTAFGLLAVLIIWYAVVAPELSKNKLDLASFQSIVGQQVTIAEAAKETSRNQVESSKNQLLAATALNASAGSINTAISRLEDMRKSMEIDRVSQQNRKSP
jgi:hypothetical protein